MKRAAPPPSTMGFVMASGLPGGRPGMELIRIDVIASEAKQSSAKPPIAFQDRHGGRSRLAMAARPND
jgi:hypothetical protein